MQKLLTQQQEALLRANYRNQIRGTDEESDYVPVVKLFCARATWLLTELDDDGIFFGLCDLGLGFPELGYVARHELEALQSRFPMIERDIHFSATKTLSEYANDARIHQRIVT